MNICDFFNENEKPLDQLPSDGGFANIFRSIACIGDSLSSGEFELIADDGTTHTYHDMFEYSWGQFMARTTGAKVLNFSRGGMTARAYLEDFADNSGFWNVNLKCQAYIIALGVNDLFGEKQAVGSTDDIKENWKDNPPTFAGRLGAIVQRYKTISPDAKFFFVTMPKESEDRDDIRQAHRKLMYDFAEKFDNSYVIDLYQYAPRYDDEFRKKFYLYGHLNPAGYSLTAKMMLSYIDYIVRHNLDDFKKLGFVAK